MPSSCAASVSWLLESIANRREPGRSAMINLDCILTEHLGTEPYRWAAIDGLFSPQDAAELAATFPRDHFKCLSHYGGDKDSEYRARALVGMGERSISRGDRLSSAWRELANDFLSPAQDLPTDRLRIRKWGRNRRRNVLRSTPDHNSRQ